MKIFAIWEYEQRHGYDREEPLDPFYASKNDADAALKAMGKVIRDGYREVREHVLIPPSDAGD